MPEATVGVASTVEEISAKTPGSRDVPFVVSREASGGSSYEADTVLAVRHGVHEDYERVLGDLGTGEEPAETVPEWSLTSMTDEGLLRVTLPSASATYVSEGALGDALLESFYVVRAPEDGMFVDVFARRTFSYRVMELSDPARLVLDFKPTGAPLKAPPPAVGGDTVLVEPRSGARIQPPLTVSGYSRNFEASNTVILTGPSGEVLVRRSPSTAATGAPPRHTSRRPSTCRLSAEEEPCESGLRAPGTFKGVEVPVRGDR